MLPNVASDSLDILLRYATLQFETKHVIFGKVLEGMELLHVMEVRPPNVSVLLARASMRARAGVRMRGELACNLTR